MIRRPPRATLCPYTKRCRAVTNDCPADLFQPSSTECRAAGGSCDVAEFCTGLSAYCPADTFKPSTIECRAAAGVCDVAEFCTGRSTDCPADAKSTAVCRPAA